MKQVVTPAIVLSRFNYGEADRIVHVITPQHGKLSILAKGVRKVRSKLAGGIELFSINTITYIDGRSELKTLTSSRVEKHFSNIVHNINRTMFAYEVLKTVHKITEDAAEEDYYELLKNLFTALDDDSVSTDVLSVWLCMQLLYLEGHAPNVSTDTHGAKLQENSMYNFSFEDMAFTKVDTGNLSDKHIKLLRLCLAIKDPRKLMQIQDVVKLIQPLVPLTRNMLQTHVRL